MDITKRTQNVRQAFKSLRAGEPPEGLAEKARKAAYEYAAENGLSIDQVGVRATAFGTVKPFTIKECD